MANPNEIRSFDEESCRYFLREVGARVVPAYPFSFGMEEVYSLILERYGYAGIPDATSVLQELLEDSDSATGLGDDGDIWRSWRHSWRHRNDDALNPFIPRVGNFVLQPPTSLHLRRLKAARQLERELAQQRRSARVSITGTPTRSSCVPNDSKTAPIADYHALSDSDAEYPASQLGATFSHQRCRIKVAMAQSETELGPVQCDAAQQIRNSDSTYPDADSLQEFAEHRRSIRETDIDPAVSLAFEMLQSDQLSVEQEVALRGGEIKMNMSGQVGSQSSMPQSRSSHVLSEDIEETLRTPARSLRYRTNDAEVTPNHEPRRRDLCTIATLPHRSPGLGADISNVTTQPSKQSSNEIAYHSVGSDVSGFSDLMTKRASHRSARLIDGAIFSSKIQRSKTVKNENISRDGITVDDSRRASFRLSWTPTRQNRRGSWMQNVRSLFRSDSQNKQHEALQKRQRSATDTQNASGSTTMTIFRNGLGSNESATPQQTQRREFGLCLDGASDERTSPSRSPINVDKALPLNPAEIVQSVSSRTRTPSLSLPQSPPTRPLTASTASTNISRSSSKKYFRGVARDLLSEDMVDQHGLLPLRETDGLDPNKHDLQKSSVPPTSPISFSSMARRNPFTDSSVPVTPVLPAPNLHYTCNERIGTSRAPSALPRSQSESSFHPFDPQHTPAVINPCSGSLRDTQPSTSPRSRGGRGGDFRGRTHQRAVSPIPVQAPRSNNDMSPQKNQKRSRSPVKRLLGIGKSTSMKDVTVDNSDPKYTKNPEIGTKSSLKKWGNKIRHGFLTADQEETEREAQIEEYLQEYSTPPRQSTFPVSLGPPYQARAQADTELLISVTANRFLMREAKVGRLSSDSVGKIKRLWELKNRPQVVEFHYDLTTQRELVLNNINTVRFCGTAADDVLALNSILHAWGVMARELSVRTFCTPDSVIRRHLHETHRIIELLGAPMVTFFAFQELQVNTLKEIADIQKGRLERRGGSGQHSRSVSDSSDHRVRHRRSTSDRSHREALQRTDQSVNYFLAFSPPKTRKAIRKATGADGALMGSPTSPAGDAYENSRGGRLGTMVRDNAYSYPDRSELA